MSSLDGDSRGGLHILSQDAQDNYIAQRKPWDSKSITFRKLKLILFSTLMIPVSICSLHDRSEAITTPTIRVKIS